MDYCGKEKLLGGFVSVSTEQESVSLEHDIGGKHDGTDQIEITGGFLSFAQVEKVGGEHKEIEKESVDKAFTGKDVPASISKIM